MPLNFFKVRKSKKFEFTPRIWDAEKEEREDRLRLIQKELGIINHTSDNKPYVPNIKGRFRKEYGQNKTKPRVGYSDRIRFFILAGAVFLLCLIFFYVVKMYPFLFTQKEDVVDKDRIELYE